MELINLDDTNTWDNNIIQLLKELNKLDDELKKTKNVSIHQKIQNKILYEEYSNKKEKIQNSIQDNLKGKYIIVYHCTRLRKIEYQNILENGLLKLNKEKQLERIENITELDEKTKIKMKKIIETDKFEKRQGRIHFVYSFSSINSGCIDFLKKWGGESIYCPIENDKDISNNCLTIGNPYVIKFKVKCEIINYDFIVNMQEKLRNGKMDGENSIKYDIQPRDIIEIIKADKILNKIENDLKN